VYVLTSQRARYALLGSRGSKREEEREEGRCYPDTGTSDLIRDEVVIMDLDTVDEWRIGSVLGG
jgi:hypothetical protein